MTVAPEPGHALVRMYNVGFGDAFLLVLPGQPRPRRVLIDCGSHLASNGRRPLGEVVAQIVADVSDDDGQAEIDVVVATHRHADHVSGFGDDAWASVTVGEVWMPWTEDPQDPDAKQIRERQTSAARHLLLALEGSDVDAPASALARNAVTEDAAIETLHEGFAGTPERRFLAKAAHGVETLEPDGLPGVAVHVLGPPRDARLIRDIDPSPAERSLRMAGALPADGAAAARKDLPPPFGPEWVVPNRTLATTPRLKHILLRGRERADVEKHAKRNLLALAVSLERAVSGTSLVLAFEVGDAVLLFPGDAQWGTWLGILDDDAARAVVGRTSFLKVGHHGSCNAIPRRAVDVLAAAARDGRELWAMVSTLAVPMWTTIPDPQLLEALGAISARVARSDQGAAATAAGFSHGDDVYVDAMIPLEPRS
jgi:hypothetical protein